MSSGQQSITIGNINVGVVNVGAMTTSTGTFTTLNTNSINGKMALQPPTLSLSQTSLGRYQPLSNSSKYNTTLL